MCFICYGVIWLNKMAKHLQFQGNIIFVEMFQVISCVITIQVTAI